MAGVIDGLTGLPAPVVVAAVFVFALLETAAFAGLAVPGETAVVLGGVVAFQGRIPLAAMCAAAAVGAITGDSIGFYLGHRFGTRLLSGRLGGLVGRERVDATMNRIRAGGIKAVILGRFVGVLRAIMPFAAGSSGMSYGRFLVASVTGGTAWGVGFTLLGYLAGNSWRRVEHYVGRASTILAVALVTVAVLVLAARAAAKRQDRLRDAWQRFLDRPRIAAVRRRYRRQIAFVAKRFKPGQVAGLQLTAALAALVALGWLLALIVVQVLRRTGLSGIDAHVREALSDQPHRVVHAIALAHDVLSVGGAIVAFGVTGLALWAFDRTPRALVVLGAALAGGAALPPTVRALVARPNPLFDGGRLLHTFPATTSTVAAATAVGILVVVLPRIARWTRKVSCTFVVVGVVIAAGFAELFTTDVYLSDVLGGGVLGALWGLAVSTVVTSVWRPAAADVRGR